LRTKSGKQRCDGCVSMVNGIDKEVSKAIIRSFEKFEGLRFPLKPSLLIVFGVAGLFICNALVPYIHEAEKIVKEIPEMEQFAKADQVKVSSMSYYDVPMPELSSNAIITVKFELQSTGVNPMPMIDGYIFDEENFTKWKKGEDAVWIAKETDLVGIMIGTTTHDGTWHVVFDNTGSFPLEAPKRINYNIRAISQAHRVIEKSEHHLADVIFYPFGGMVIVGVLGIMWWYKKHKKID